MSKNDRFWEAMSVLRQGGKIPDDRAVREGLVEIFEAGYTNERPYIKRTMARAIIEANPDIDPYAVRFDGPFGSSEQMWEETRPGTWRMVTIDKHGTKTYGFQAKTTKEMDDDELGRGPYG